MNVLHLSHTDIESDSRILKEMHAIASMDSKATVFGIGVKLEEGSSQTESAESLEIHSIILRTRSWRWLPVVVRHFFSLIELTFKMLRRAVAIKPSVIHCNDTLVLPLGVLLKFYTGAKLIYDAHELESDRNGLTVTLGKLTLFVERSLWRFVDSLIVVSPSIATWYASNVGDKDTTIILNSPVLGSGATKFDDSYLRDKYQIPKLAKIFIYIGILGDGRGIDLILEAFQKNEVTAHVVFLGYGLLKSNLLKVSKEQHNIHVHDAVPHEDVVSVAKSADVGLCLIQNVSLSDYYCLPNKLFEYCFAGVPVLASKFPDIVEVVDKYKLGVCSQLDSESIYEAIIAIEELDRLPVIDVEKLYDLSWGAQAQKLAKLYAGLTLVKD